MKKLKAESDLLDIKFRKKVIDEITGAENVERKNRALRAYEIFNGQTKKWVIELLSREFDAETVAQMQNRATNISILRKVVSKLASTYTAGVVRESKGEQKDFDALVEALGLDGVQDKADRFYELFRNALVSTVPIRNYRESEQEPVKDRYDLALRVLPPHHYDVIEDESNPEVPRVIILTDFVERGQGTAIPSGSNINEDGRPSGVVSNVHKGDGIDQIIADSPDDEGRDSREFIFWSDSYHFTCDRNGEIVPGKQEDDLSNPIKELPFVPYVGDQDGSYYASNWEDKVDGAIHINVALTDMFCIAMVQGWGQPVLTGEKLPEKVKGGPHNAIMLKQQSGAPEAKFYYATSSPPLDQWMRMVELEVAVYLSTNNLSPSTVSAKLDAQSMASGVAMLIERSESTSDITKKHRMFQAGEKEVVRKVSLWHKVMSDKNSLTNKFKELKTIDAPDFTTKFLPPKPVISEKEHVETLKARKDLGLNTMLDLIRIDNPGISEEDGKKKLAEIDAEKTAKAEKFGLPAVASAQPGEAEEAVPENEPPPVPGDDQEEVEGA